MRKELYGPAPLALGVVALVAAVLATNAPAPADCACPVDSPADFEARDGAGYPGTALGDTVVVDGQVVAVFPHPIVESPYRLIRMAGSPIQFNITELDAPVPFEGAWVRVTTVHQGQSESGGPETGHRWRYTGPTTPEGDAVVPLTGYSVGLVGVLWGLATLRLFQRTKETERSLKTRHARARDAAGAEPAVARDSKALNALSAARREIRFGQLDSAAETLSRFEELLTRAQGVGKMSAEIGATLSQQEDAVGSSGNSSARVLVEKAAEHHGAGDLAGAEATLDLAMVELRAGARAADLLRRARALSGEGPDDAGAAERVTSAAAEAERLLRAGKWAEADTAAAKAVVVAVAASPLARRAKRAMGALEESMHANRTGDAPREVSHQLAAARSAFASGDYRRAEALAESARWLVDEQALDEEGFRDLMARLWEARGYRADEGAGRPPAGGLVVSKGAERLLLLTGSWREFPTERLLLAAKDFLREGHAQRARVYSSAFANTSTDPTITVVTSRELLAELAEAAALEDDRPG